MKNYTRLISLLPCQAIDDFPDHCSRDNAQSLLAAWTGLWHPALIASAGAAPIWRPAICTPSSEEEADLFHDQYVQDHYYNDDECEDHDLEEYSEFDTEVFGERWRGSCVVIPALSQTKVYKGFAAAAREIDVTVISDFKSRSELLSLASIESDIDPQLVNDFFSLAYVRLQVELMTRKLRYSSELDLERFGETALEAAKAAADGNEAAAKQHLQSGFDQLAEERNQYYPVDAELLDLVLLSESLRPESISAELASVTQQSLVLSGSTLRGIADKSPEIISTINDRIEQEDLGIIAGPQHELPEDLLSLETSRRQLKQSVASFKDVLDYTPEVFMRRRAGLHAALPALLASSGFRAAIHATLDQGELPESSNTGSRWSGADGSELLALGKVPLDAASDKSFLDLGQRIGHDLDAAHVSALLFARWPTQTCDSFEDLRNSVRYGKVLGDFTHAGTWLENAYDPGYSDTWEADEYVAPWFQQAIDSKSQRPVSTFLHYWKNYYRASAARNLCSILALEAINLDPQILKRISRIQDRIEEQTQTWNDEEDETIESDLEAIETDLAGRSAAKFINSIPWRNNPWLTFASQGDDVPVSRGDATLKLVTQNSSRCDAVVELSGFGQLLAHPANALKSETSQPVSEKPADDSESVLRNELFEVRVDPKSGGIKGVYFYAKRGNLLSQTIGFRQFDKRIRQTSYGKMVCDSFELIRHSNIASAALASGSIVGDDGKCLARFVQQISLQRGRNVIDIEITFSDIQADSLSSKKFFVNRIAWSDEAAELFCDMQGARHAVRKPEIEAPHFVEVVGEENRFALLTHGLPWHRRVSKKNLDSILIAGQEQQRTFRLGIAINSESAMQTAIAEMHPRHCLPDASSKTGDLPLNSGESSKWLLHIANRNLIITSTTPTLDSDGHAIGMTLCLQEIDTQPGTLKLYACRTIESAVKRSLDGEHLRDITCREESSPQTPSFSVMETAFNAAELFVVQLRW